MIKLSKEKPYEDACKILGLHPVANYKSYKLTDETRNFIKLETIAKALNEGWKPTTMDPKEVRYCVWGWNYTDNRKPSGLLAVGSGGGLGDAAHASVGTSLEFKDRDTAKEFARIELKYPNPLSLNFLQAFTPGGSASKTIILFL